MSRQNQGDEVKTMNPQRPSPRRHWATLFRKKSSADESRIQEPLSFLTSKKLGKKAERSLEQLYKESENLDPWLHHKTKRLRKLQKDFAADFSGHIYLTNFFGQEAPTPEGATLKVIDEDNMPRSIEHSIVLFNNNNLINEHLREYVRLYQNSPTSIFAIWDFDNHHWLELSYTLAAFSDLYIPAHSENLALFSRCNPAVTSPIHTAVIQWTREFLQENRHVIFEKPRSDQPLGGHIKWDQFPVRNRTLEKLSRFYPEVRAVSAAYHRESKLDRLAQWSSHKAHWVVPVLTDLPIRTFDALITGGIPIVPKALRRNALIRSLEEHLFFYDAEDVENPTVITEAANRRFDELGTDGIQRRHEIALTHHHLENRLESIFSALYEEFHIG